MRYIVLILLLAATTIQAQHKLSITIQPIIDGVNYSDGSVAKNDMDQSYRIERMEYYLSGFEIIHDQGQVTALPDLYALVSLSADGASTTIDLGEHNFGTIEGIRFMQGVDSVNNHADPSLWPADHPLAPKNPSMHWGWASGYRFIALEGYAGPNLDQRVEIHCIGDQFYQEIAFDLNTKLDGDLDIPLRADYGAMLDYIDISNGLILHGNLGEIKIAANNLRNRVFELASPLSNQVLLAPGSLKAFPNPSPSGDFTLRCDHDDVDVYHIYDATGRLLQQLARTNRQDLHLAQRGLYTIQALGRDGRILDIQKIIVP